MTDSAQDGAIPDLGGWAFVGRIPTTDEVSRLLQTLDPIMGIDTADYIDFVQAIDHETKFWVFQGDHLVEQKIRVWRLYMAIAGRIAMANKIAEHNSWRFDLEPQPFLVLDDQEAVYRCMATFLRPAKNDNGEWWETVGTKPGMAQISRKMKNWAQIVETRAHGRAIANWGIGLLPGSGVASLEEVQDVVEGSPRRQEAQARQEAETKSPQALQEEFRDLVGQLMVLRGIELEEQLERMARYFKSQWNTDVGQYEKVGDDQVEVIVGLDLDKIVPARLALANRMLRQQVQKESAEQAPV